MGPGLTPPGPAPPRPAPPAPPVPAPAPSPPPGNAPHNNNGNSNNSNGNGNSNSSNNKNNSNNGPSALLAGPGEICDGGRACNGGAGLFYRRGFGADRPTCRYFVAPCSACKRRDAGFWHNYYCDNGSGVCTANQRSA